MRFSWHKPERRPIIVAHRGSSEIAPENTSQAFRRACEDGADAIELDVHLSGDGHVVVIHDESIDRTTDGKGKVRGYTFRQLKKYNAASGWNKRFVFESIPSLEDVLAEFGNKIGINIEIKKEQTSKTQHELLRKTMNLITRYKLIETVLVSSFSSKVIKEAGMLDSRIGRGLLYDPVSHALRSPVVMAKSLGVKYLILNRRVTMKRTVKAAHVNDMLVGEYAVDTHPQAARSIRYGIDVLFTNHPLKILSVLERQ